MSKRNDADYVNTLLQEAFDALAPHSSGGSDEVNRKADVRARIAGYLASHGGLMLPPGGGGGGPATFGGCGSPSMESAWIARAKEYGKPVCFAGGCGGGTHGFIDWAFPDGHTERLPAGETPKWPKNNAVRDAVRANQ